MAYQIRFMPELGTVVVRFSGEVAPDEVERAMNEVPAQPWFRPQLKAIVDTRDCTITMTGADVRWLADYGRRVDPAWGETKWAIIAESDLIYGLARMYMALTADYRVQTHVFRDIQEADDWLGIGVPLGEALARAA